MPDGSPVEVRPLLPTDVAAAQEASWEALREAGTRYGWTMPELDEDGRARGRARVAHLQRTDPGGSWVADAAGEVVGVALALRRGPLWFLSLLTVSPGVQAQGVGRRLLDAALTTAADARSGLVMSSSDPKALRRYGLAGFDLVPGLEAVGAVDRSLLPAVEGVREGGWDADGERLDDLGRRVRGAAYGPDLEVLRDTGARLLVAPRGAAVLKASGDLVLLAAEDADTAERLLWSALAQATGELEVGPITAANPWATRVALQARLALRPGSSLCVRGEVGPLAPYVASGAYG